MFQTADQVARAVENLLVRVAELEKKLEARDERDEKPKVTTRSR
jgi:hypothetical protein